MSKFARFAFCLLSLLSFGLLPRSASALPFDGLYVLGDSLSDEGNLYAATAALGPSLTPPAAAQPASDHYYSGRFSNGPVYAEQLATDLGVSISASLLGGTNFAFGGARTDYNTVEVPPYGTQVFPRSAYPWSLNGERAAFTSYIGAHGADPNALYVVFSGSNDVTDIVQQRLNPVSTIANAVAGIVNTVDAFKAAGARTVLVPNLPNIGVTPRVTALIPRIPNIVAIATSLITQFNTELSTALDAETGIQILRFDTFDFLSDVVANPSKYGFSNSTEPCYSGFVTANPTATVCANPDQYVFWDSEHPTTAFHTLLGNAMFDAVLAVPEPTSLGLLGVFLLGFGALGAVRGRSVSLSRRRVTQRGGRG